MTQREIKIVKEFIKGLPEKTRICMINAFKKLEPKTIKELIELSIKCLEDKGGSEEQIKILGLFKGDYVEIQDIKKEEKKIKHKPPKR